MDINREKLIRHKVKRFLSSEEETIFEQLIQSDHSFSEAYQDHKDIHLMIKASEKEAIKQQLNQIEKHIQKRSVKKLWYSISGIAAVIVFCLLCNPFQNASQEDLYNQYFQTYPNTYQPVVRGDSNALTLAFVAYENGDYSKSSILFNQLLAQKENENIQFYYAMSLLYLQNTEQALKEFDTLETVDFQYQKQVLWYKGLILLKTDEPEKSKLIFEKLRSDFPDYKKKETKLILLSIE